MALNPNHTFEELEEIKCSVVEKNCNAERVKFLKELLEYNHLTVVVVKSPPPKSSAKSTNTEEAGGNEIPSSLAETFTIGVTDLSFNSLNAIYNRELKTKDGKIVTPAVWKQSETNSKEDLWYWKK